MSARRIVLALAVLAAGCNAILGINEPNEIPPDGGSPDGSGNEAGGVDASGGDTSSDATNDGKPPPLDSGVNELTDPSFELGCTGFDHSGFEFSQSDDSHTGAHACLVCATGTGYFQLMRIVRSGTPVVDAGATFHFEAWVKKAVGRDAATPVTLEWEIDIGGPAGDIQQDTLDFRDTLDEVTWDHLVGDVTATTVATDAGQANAIRMDIGSRRTLDSPADRCFLLDDVVFRATN